MSYSRARTLLSSGRRTVPRIAIIEDDAATSSTLQLALAEEGYDAVVITGPGDLLAQFAVCQARPGAARRAAWPLG